MNEVDKMAVDIEQQGKVVEKLERDIEVNENSSVKLQHTDEWKMFEKTALLRKLVDEEITLLDLRLKRMEMKVMK